MAKLHPAQLHDFVTATCVGLGSEKAEATLVADQLVGANLTGHDSHGVGMLPHYVEAALGGRLAVNQHATVVRDSGAVVVLDGNSGFGQVMGHEAMERGIAMARAHGVGLVGLRNSFHIGRIGHWAEQCAAQGLASLHLVNVAGHAPYVAPHGGADGRFATNPICIALPGSDGKPVAMLDMATSKIALGKVRVAHNSGNRVPEGTLIDSGGRATTDPGVMFSEDSSGALTTAGDHKGSGLAIMCELLGAALIGGDTVQPANVRDGRIVNNMLSVIINPDATNTSAAVFSEAEAYLDYVVASPLREGSEAVLLPGQPEQIARLARAEGFEVDATTIAQLRSAAEAAGLTRDVVDAGLEPRPAAS